MLMMPPDLTALSWCFGELRQSLMQADTQLGAALAGGESGTAELEQATLSLHRADGAMQLLVLPGVSQITRQADALVQAMLSAGVQLDEARLRSLRRAFHALIEYCEGLLRLDPPQPLHLFPYYRDLLLARGEQGAQPCDLFFPDLSVSLPVSQLPLGEDDPQLLGHARSMFERGLLALMRSPDSEGARSMQDAVSMVCASALASRDRAFWWVAQAFFDSLADATLSLDAQVKRMLARVNQKLRKAIEQDNGSDPRLLAEMMFLLARVEMPNEAASEVRRVYRLDDAVPEDLEAARFDPVDPQVLAEAGSSLERSLQALQGIVDGNLYELKTFADCIEAFVKTCLQVPGNGLRELCKGFEQVRDVLLARQTVPAGAVALDIATAILYAQRAIADGAKPGSAYDRRGADMVRYLTAGFAIGGADTAGLPDWVQQQELAAIEPSMIKAFVSEISTELREAEQHLDAYFSDPQQADRLEAGTQQLERIASAFQLLDDQSSAQSIRLLVAQVAQIGSAEEEPASTEVDRLAESIAALGFFIARLQQPDPGKRPFNAQRAFGEFQADWRIELPVLDRVRQGGALPRSVQKPESTGTISAAPRTRPSVQDQQAAGPARNRSEPQKPAASADPGLLDKFLAETSERLEQIAAQAAASRGDPQDLQLLEQIHGDFEWIKSSSLMVGLTGFGDAAQALAKLLNDWLQTRQVGRAALYNLIDEARAQMGAWIALLVGNPQAVSAIDASVLVAEAATLSPELLSSGQQAPEPQAQAEPEPETPSDTQSELDLVQIGDRELSRKLYMIFLAEADELIELLCADALSWQREPERSPTEAAIRAAHSLAGSSAIVGLEQVRQIAALIEQFMLAQQHAGRAPQASDFEALLELTGRVRAMLHQFAGGADPREDDEALALARALASDAGRQPDALTSEPQAALFASGTQAASTIPLPVDEIDPEFLPVFIEEASDLMPQIGEDLRRWQAGPAVSSAPETLMRRLHTVKGSARMAGAMGLGQLLHEIETRLEALAALPSVSAAQIDELIAEHDRADSMFQRIRGSASEGEQPALSSVPQAEPDPGSPVLPNQAFASEQAGAGDDAEIGRAAPDPELAPEPRDTDRSLGRTRDPGYPQPMLRVRADLLDRLVDEAGEVSIARSRLDNELTALRVALGELTENVNRLRSHLRDIEIQAESQIQARIAQQREHEASFDPLEFDRFTRSQELTRMLAESVNDVATVQQNAARSLQDASQDLHRQGQVVRDLQQNLMRMRMLRFGSISDRLHRVVRQTARQLDKQAHLEIRGPEVEIDRSVLERMAGPIEHLLRNAVMHGIESPAQRLAQGKPESGQIRIEARQEGRDITLVFSDDGAGLNLDRIRERALQTGLLQAQSQASPGDLAELIFSPGFSTASTVTEIAGRGVGMDAVRSEIAGLGGSIKIESTPGKGTSFQVVLPLSLAVAQVVLVCAGEHRYAINSSSVEKRLQVKPQELAQSYGQGRFECEGTQVPLHYLGTLVDLPGVTPLAQHHAPVLILRSGTKRIALHCDEVSPNQDVVVKAVGPQVAQVPGITGATVLGNGQVVLIINPVAIAQPPEGGQHQPTLDEPAISALLAKAQPPVVMVVDDSITVRKVTQRLLLREGYEVLLARDGVDALRQIAETMPDLMLVDIEMPRMDGFDLTRNIRGQSTTAHIPIIMITSRTADKHRSFALSLGVDAFLGKPFSEDKLLTQIALLISEGRKDNPPRS